MSALQDYLECLGLSREEIAELSSGTVTIEEFVDRKIMAEAEANKKEGEETPEEWRMAFCEQILEAEAQLAPDNTHERWQEMPYIPGLTAGMLIAWAEDCRDKYG
jgi:hypothetical protein